MNFYKKSKYHAKKTEYNGIVYDSKKEASFARDLDIMERAGRVKDVSRQVRFQLIPAQYEPSTDVYKRGPNIGQLKQGKCIEKSVDYVADFVFFDVETNQTQVVDTKGVKTKDYIIKRKLMLYVHGIRIHEV